MKHKPMLFHSKTLLFFFLSSILLFSCTKNIDPPINSSFIQAADISFLPQIEANGITFFDQNSKAADPLLILKENGINTIRLRIWKNPQTQHSSLDEVLSFTQRLRDLDLKLWLSVHYSDTWADPGKQIIPNQWNGLSHQALLDSVYQYTAKISTLLAPDIIQIGNEINNGFLHPQGNIWSNEDQFVELLSEASKAIRTNIPESKIMMHYAGTTGSFDFFEKISSVDYDAIGLSYYPIWHGKDIDALETTLFELKEHHGKEIYIAEMAYPFSLAWNDWTTNIIGSEDQLILPDFPATTEGQKSYIRHIKDRLLSIDAEGLAYWGATYVAFDGPNSTDGSSWENQALFGFNNAALKALDAFNN